MFTNTTASARRIALVAGIGYLFIFVTGIFANFFVIEGMVMPGDPAGTLRNLQANPTQLRIGVLSFIIMVVADLLLTWALYVLFRPVNAALSSFAAMFRLVNVAIFGMALSHLMSVLTLTGAMGNIGASPAGYVQVAVMRSVTAFQHTWLIGLLFFGIHLLALASLAVRSGSIPRFITLLLAIAGGGYLTDSIAQFMLADYDAYKTIFSTMVIVPGVLGELSFTIWLLAKGMGRKRTHLFPDVTRSGYDAAVPVVR